jgi:ribosomal protein S8
MVRVSVLNDALKNMYNAEKRGKRQVLLRPSSKVVIKFLQVMQRHGKSSSRLAARFACIAPIRCWHRVCHPST